MGKLDGIHIVVFSEHYSGLHSGGRLYSHLMTHALASEGAKVTLSTNYLPSYHLEYSDIPGHENIEIIAARNWGGAKKLKSIKANLCIGVVPSGVSIGKWYKANAHVPFIILCFDTPNWLETTKNYGIDVFQEYKKLREKWREVEIFSKYADCAIHCTEEGEKWGAEYFGLHQGTGIKHVVLRPTINIFKGSKVLADLPFELREGACCISRLSYYKRQSMAIDICREAGIKKLSCIGWDNMSVHSGPLSDHATNSGVELHLFQNISEEHKFDILQKSKVLISPTTFEGYGLPIEEALYVGTPVVATNLLVFRESYGDHIQYADTVDEFAAKVKELYNNKECWDKWYKKGKKLSSKITNFFIYASKLADIVLSTLNKDKIVDEPFTIPVSEKKKISIIMPLWKPDIKFFDIAMRSLTQQTYHNWELCVGVDGPDNNTISLLKKYNDMSGDRIKWKVLPEHKGIPGATGAAMDIAKGDYWAFMDADDQLDSNAFREVIKAFEGNPKWKMLYTNERHVDGKGRHIGGNNKPDWNHDLFCQMMFINHLKVFRANVAKKVGKPSSELSLSQDYDWIWRFIDFCKDDEIGHIPEILYNWRLHGSNMSSGKTSNVANPTLAFAQGGEATKRHLKRIKFNGKLIPTQIPCYYELNRNIVGNPHVKILLLTNKNVSLAKSALDAIIRETHYDNYEICVGHHLKDAPPQMRELLNFYGVDVVDLDGEFNYAHFRNQMLNKYANKCDYVVLMDDDITVTHNWLTKALGVATQDPKIGIVGAKLLFPSNNRDILHSSLHLYPPPTFLCANYQIQHAGVYLSRDGGCAHMYYKRFGDYVPTVFVREVEAVTSALVLIKSEVFKKIKFDEENFPINFPDIDLCLQAAEQGWKIIYCNQCLAWHREGATRMPKMPPEDIERFKNKWHNILKDKPTKRERDLLESRGL